MTDNLKRMCIASVTDYHNDLIQHIRDKTPVCDIDPFEKVMKGFIQAILDLSINHRSVHFINSTDIEFDDLYAKFEKDLIKECSSFIK